MFLEPKTSLQHLLQKQADPGIKAWWEGYVKESAPFMGVRMPAIRSVLHKWYEEFVAKNLDYEQQVDLALALFEGNHAEEKLAGTLFLQEILLPTGAISWKRDVDRFADLFASGKIYDWNICDWFCVKVLGPLIKKDGLECARRISEWRSADNLWQARASVVAFVKVADNSIYYPLVEESCLVLIGRRERFAKTAVGWILRDISKVDKSFVRRLVEENIQDFSLEALKNATRYFSNDSKKRCRQMLQEV